MKFLNQKLKARLYGPSRLIIAQKFQFQKRLLSPYSIDIDLFDRSNCPARLSLSYRLLYILVYPDSMDPVVGASGAISGVFGGVLILMRYVGSLPSLLPVAGVWIALNVFFGIVGGTPGAGGDPVAWTAHIGGFVYGLAAIRLFMPRPPS